MTPRKQRLGDGRGVAAKALLSASAISPSPPPPHAIPPTAPAAMVFADPAVAVATRSTFRTSNYVKEETWIPHPNVSRAAVTIPLWPVFIIQRSFDCLWGN